MCIFGESWRNLCCVSKVIWNYILLDHALRTVILFRYRILENATIAAISNTFQKIKMIIYEVQKYHNFLAHKFIFLLFLLRSNSTFLNTKVKIFITFLALNSVWPCANLWRVSASKGKLMDKKSQGKCYLLENFQGMFLNQVTK